jgi:hypothetical protein
LVTETCFVGQWCKHTDIGMTEAYILTKYLPII